MRVVPATVQDVELCFGIARAAALAGFRNVFPPELYEFPDEAIRAHWASALGDPGSETSLAVDVDEAVGVVSLRAGVIQTLYVLPAFWGRGVGSMLHDHALDRLRETGVAEARLWTLAANDRARTFYEHRGWSLTGRTRVVPHPPHPIDVEYRRSTSHDPGGGGDRPHRRPRPAG